MISKVRGSDLLKILLRKCDGRNLFECGFFHGQNSKMGFCECDRCVKVKWVFLSGRWEPMKPCFLFTWNGATLVFHVPPSRALLNHFSCCMSRYPSGSRLLGRWEGDGLRTTSVARISPVVSSDTMPRRMFSPSPHQAPVGLTPHCLYEIHSQRQLY